MVKKYLKSNRGSTLILVLVTLSILSILGTAIIGLSVMNYKMKVMDKNIKTSFYLAEAGLEEAYAVVGKEIEAAIEEGNKYIDDNLEEKIREEREKEEENPEENESDYIMGSSGHGSVNEAFLKMWIEEKFEEVYKKHLDDDDDGIDKKVAGTTYSVVNNDIDTKAAEVKIVGSPKKFGDGNEYELTLESTFEHNKITKTVRGTFKIGIPKYNTPYYVKNVVANFQENVLWTKPITTEKNIYALGDNVNIEGDIYAYGSDRGNQKGGIIVESDGLFAVNGNIATNRYIYTNKSNSKIGITGDIYCDSLSIPYGTSGCSITVKSGAVNTYDDIDLNGTASKIEIQGPYFGFSDGSLADEHDESSSIVINSSDIGDDEGSSITITGEEVSKNNKLNTNIGNYITDNTGVYLAGTVYINLLDQVSKYQTGESVSIKGNYKAYGEYLKPVAGRGEDFNPVKTEMGSFPPLVLISKLNGADSEPSAIQKSNYLNFYNEDFPSKLDLGGENGVKISNLRYSAGAFITNNVLDNNLGTVELWNNYSYGKEDDYNYFVNKMSDYFNYKDPYDMDLDDRVYISNRFSYSEDVNVDGYNETVKDEVILVNTNGTKDIFLIGVGGDHEPSQYNSSRDKKILTDNSIDGVIITKGNVYISGEITYRGVIAAEGSIYFVDDNTKTIKNQYGKVEDKSYILNAMHKNQDLAEQFTNGKEETYLVEVEAGQDTETKSYLKFEDLVDIEWQKIK